MRSTNRRLRMIDAIDARHVMNGKYLLFAAAVGTMAGGCQGSTVVAGNLATMCIVVLMLWSTLRLNRG